MSKNPTTKQSKEKTLKLSNREVRPVAPGGLGPHVYLATPVTCVIKLGNERNMKLWMQNIKLFWIQNIHFKWNNTVVTEIKVFEDRGI